MSNDPTDPDATIPHLFDEPPPIKVTLATAERISTERGLPNAKKFHQRLQGWIDQYYLVRDWYKLEPITPQKNEARSLSKSIEKTLLLIDSDTRAARWFRKNFNQSNSTQIEELAVQLRQALLETSQEIEKWEAIRKAAKTDSRNVPAYFQLKLLFRDIGFYWDELYASVSVEKFSYYVPETTGEPGNRATRLALDIATVVDPTLRRETILSQFKNYSRNPSVGGSWTEIFISHHEP